VRTKVELQAFFKLRKGSFQGIDYSEGSSREPNNQPLAEGALAAGGGENARKGENTRKGKHS
jgi:hypothetical protein